jgi:pyridoxal phosphate enzyme (YggS family)
MFIPEKKLVIQNCNFFSLPLTRNIIRLNRMMFSSACQRVFFVLTYTEKEGWVMMMREEELKQNYETVKKRMEEACLRVGRDPGDVQLLAVSKTRPIEDIEILQGLGQVSFGENYVQEIMQKYEVLGEDVDWQMIGHLQRNKVKYIIDKVSLIHAVDTVKLAEQIEKEAAKKDIAVNVLMEVNIAREESKWGFTAEESLDAARMIGTLPHVRLHGLMTSAPITDNPETNRPYFHQMKDLAAMIDSQQLPGVMMDTLSMGMTDDFETAIEEGATVVRIGTAIFGPRHETEN